MNTLVTIACIIALVLAGLIAYAMWRAIQRDRRELDERDKRELEGWDDDV